ncbi:hypothetical protein [Streptomyces sp. Inha503]|uniref:hypothetical protein n=1 Tax=Streptomyces sp. Inha503 TaxID=3383314 RepID=UPI0039A23601
MKLKDKEQIARIALWGIGEKYGYALGGSLARLTHGLADREPNDIDLFSKMGDQLPSAQTPYTTATHAKAEASNALQEAGYQVRDTGGSLAQFGMEEMVVSHPRRPDDEVRIEFGVPPEGHSFQVTDPRGNGMRVISAGDLVRFRADDIISQEADKEGLRTAMRVKAFADWEKIDSRLEPQAIAYHLFSGQLIDAEEFRSALNGNRDISDRRFRSYGLSDRQVRRIRRELPEKVDSYVRSWQNLTQQGAGSEPRNAATPHYAAYPGQVRRDSSQAAGPAINRRSEIPSQNNSRRL